MTVLLFQSLTSPSCAGYKEETQCWLNVKYVECLKNRLPCECQEAVGTYYQLALEVNAGSDDVGVALSKFEWMEPGIYPIRRIALNEYAVIRSQQDVSAWATIVVNGDELRLTEGATTLTFSPSTTSKKYNVQHYLTDNVQLLNEAFAMRGYPKMEEIVKADTLRCDCNKWMGNIDLLYVKGAPRSWIMEMTKDSLIISKITNADRDPDDSVQTERVSSYKWR